MSEKGGIKLFVFRENSTIEIFYKTGILKSRAISKVDVKTFLKSTSLLVGFHSDFFDNHYINALLKSTREHSYSDMKNLVNMITEEKTLNEPCYLNKYNLNTFDLKVMLHKRNVSLNDIACSTEMSLKQNIDFNINFNDEMLKKLIEYNIYDLKITLKFYKIISDKNNIERKTFQTI